MDTLQDVLRPLLKPITNNLPTPADDLALSLLGKECHASLVREITLTDQACLKLAISKALGLGIVGAASVVKVPQIAKLVASGSGAGVSVLSYVLETAAYAVSLAYSARSGFPFSTYGETALIAAQNVIITVLVLGFDGRRVLATAFVGALAFAATALFSQDLIGMDTMALLQAGAGALGVASKVFNYLLGSLTRIFTTIQEVDDKLVLYGYVAGFILNAILAAQMLYYWNAPSTKSEKKREEKPPSYADAVKTTTSTGASPSPSRKGPSTRRRA
ncbi:mannose-P-dolichol utilization defect 1 protein [Sodiomyces alkalinus F11]|uniref:Solute carrier family 66 member 3 n=1 Tax=Sodiomyces alkalinus (strain CBS 110278 / VKM F-3762 / F11) TaxID=1314773 RepID=A0A3N2QAD3_SODAK|nr:mannose-P-dolichol utilization defect 1 protein [Sodiomyces alkalinus F11]ROT43628.1 mannose-P-dolichol utilization defect 1 protein [Sodiomyces alkalinus F11]